MTQTLDTTAALSSTLPTAALYRGLLEPAFAGQTRRVMPVVTALRADPSAPGVALVVAARALWALGQVDQAEVLLDRALAQGEPEAVAMASLSRPDGDAFLQARIHSERFDDVLRARCDAAARALAGGAVAVAQAHISAALALEPHHGEACHFARFLAGAGMDAARRWQGLSSVDPVLDGDVRELKPRAHLGWLSLERWRRTATLPAVAHEADDAAAHLATLGVSGRRFAMAEEYVGLPANHPLVTCERLLDLAENLAREGRTCGETSLALWEAARETDLLTLADAAQALVTLGLRSVSAASVGLLASSVLRELEPDRQLWGAYHARLLYGVGRRIDARREARTLANHTLRDPVSAVLVYTTLALSGDVAGARLLGQRYEAHALIGPALEPLIQKRLRPEHIQTQLADRMCPRCPSGSATGAIQAR